MRGRIKICTALTIVLIMIASILIPALRVSANTNYTYTLTFTVAAGKNHTIAPHMNGDQVVDGELVIDGVFTGLVDGNNHAFGEVSVANDGKSATITVTDGPSGHLSFNSNAFLLFDENGEIIDNQTNLSENMEIKIQDYTETYEVMLTGVVQPGARGEYSVPFQCDNVGSNVEITMTNAAGYGVPVFYAIQKEHYNGQNQLVNDWFLVVNKDANLTFTITPGTDKRSDSIMVNGSQELCHDGTVDGTREASAVISQNYMSIDINIEDDNPPPGGEQETTNECGNPNNSNTNSMVTVSGQKFADLRMSINQQDVRLEPRQALNETNNDESRTRKVYYNTNPADETVTMDIGTLFIQKITSITINDVNYPIDIDYNDREDWLDHYAGQIVGIQLEVPKAANYVIEVNIDDQPQDKQFIGNFLWTAEETQEYELDPDGHPVIDHDTGEPRKNDNYIGHSKLQLVKVVYERNGAEVTVDLTDEQALIDANIDQGEIDQGPGEYWHGYTDGNFEYGYKTKEENQPVDYDEGSLVVPEGAMVTMKIIPEYGYQVTSFGINGGDILTGANISEFTFEVKKGNFHLGAQVEEVGNTVATGEDTGIKSGTIEIANDVIDEGTARLFIANNEDVSEEKVAEFEEAAKDYLADGYEISNYLDISLAQVFYKGTSDDVWVANELEDTHATMTLKLEDDNFDPETTAIIHNVKDGDEFEKVDFTYDADTNSIEMESDTFSTFAIVSKTKVASTDSTKTDAINTPKTGDNIMIFASVFIVAVVVYIAITIKRHNIKISKKH